VRAGSIRAPKSNDRHFTSFLFSFFSSSSFFSFFLFLFFFFSSSFFFFFSPFLLFFWDRALKEYGSFGKKKKRNQEQ
jgi:hypothetical protein